MSLLIENATPKKSFFFGNIFRWAVLLLMCAVFYLLSQSALKLFIEKLEISPFGGLLRHNELEALYASKAVPQSLQDIDSLNYGLDGASDAGVDEIDGYILFTGLLKKVPESSNNVYFMDVSETAPEAHLFLPDFVRYSAFVEVMDIFSPHEFLADALHSTLTQSESAVAKSSHSVQKYNVIDESLQSYTSVDGTYVQNLDWSDPARKLAYSRLSAEPTSYADLVPIENWEVVISDIDTDTELFVQKGAVQPKWSPDGSKLLMLKQDGLYVYDTASKTEKRAVDIAEGQLLATSMIDVSPDGSHLAWTSGKAGVISMYEITSWEPFVLNELGRTHVNDTEYYWPQFSPDGNYYVVLAIDALKEGDNERKNPRFEIRSTTDRTVLRRYPLLQFDINSFFIDTWIQILPEEAALTEN